MYNAGYRPRIPLTMPVAFAANIASLAGMYYVFGMLLGQDITSGMSNGHLYSSNLEFKYAVGLVFMGLVAGFTGLLFLNEADATPNGLVNGTFSIMFMVINVLSGLFGIFMFFMFGITGLMMMSFVGMAPAIAALLSAMWLLRSTETI